MRLAVVSDLVQGRKVFSLLRLRQSRTEDAQAQEGTDKVFKNHKTLGALNNFCVNHIEIP
jgi:hypothetical protein